MSKFLPTITFPAAVMASDQMANNILRLTEQLSALTDQQADLTKATRALRDGSNSAADTQKAHQDNFKVDPSLIDAGLKAWLGEPAMYAALSECASGEKFSDHEATGIKDAQDCINKMIADNKVPTDGHYAADFKVVAAKGFTGMIKNFAHFNVMYVTATPLATNQKDTYGLNVEQTNIAVIGTPPDVGEVFAMLADSVVQDKAVYRNVSDALRDIANNSTKWDIANSTKWDNTTSFYDVIVGHGYAASLVMDAFKPKNDKHPISGTVPLAITTRRVISNPFLTSMVRSMNKDLAKMFEKLGVDLLGDALNLVPMILSAALATQGVPPQVTSLIATPCVGIVKGLLDEALDGVVNTEDQQDIPGFDEYNKRLTNIVNNHNQDATNWKDVKDQWKKLRSDVDGDVEMLKTKGGKAFKDTIDTFTEIAVDKTKRDDLYNKIYETNDLRFVDAAATESLDMFVRLSTDPVSACAGPSKMFNIDVTDQTFDKWTHPIIQSHSADKVRAMLMSKKFARGRQPTLQNPQEYPDFLGFGVLGMAWKSPPSCCEVVSEDAEELLHSFVVKETNNFCGYTKPTDGDKATTCKQDWDTCHNEVQGFWKQLAHDASECDLKFFACTAESNKFLHKVMKWGCDLEGQFEQTWDATKKKTAHKFCALVPGKVDEGMDAANKAIQTALQAAMK